MDVLKTLDLPENYYNYGLVYQRISNYMKSKGMLSIGALDYCKKFPLINGEERTHSLDMEKPIRIYRTLRIVQLEEDAVEKIHEYENKKINRFLVAQEMRKLVGQEIKHLHALTETQFEYVEKFTRTNRPECRKIEGISVPPYFPLDYEFDGKEYHHAWDMNAWMHRAVFDLPQKKRASEEI